MRDLRMAFAAALVLAGLVAPPRAAAQPDPGEGYTPRFEEADCPFDAPARLLAQFRCGWLVVPENRAAPQGRQLRLAVAILQSTSPAPRPDPIVFLDGGPGSPTLRMLPQYLGPPTFPTLRAERDVVFFDQRGVGHSEPEFCPELSPGWVRINLSGLPAEERRARRRALFAECREAMERSGVDLSQYNSVAGAYDVRDLRLALGYPAWNLFGISYGTRLALEVMRLAPEGVRSVVLDSPAPPNVAKWADVTPFFADAVGRLAAHCRQDPRCDAAHPELEGRIWSTVEALHERPLQLRRSALLPFPDPAVIDGFAFAGMLHMTLYDRRFLSLAPLLVEQAARGNTEMLLAFVAPLNHFGSAMSMGMHKAVECYDSAPFNGLEVFERRRGRYPEVLDRIAFVDGAGDLDLCDAWHPFRAEAALGDAVRSNVPTLILSGELDPVTPPVYARAAAAGLSNAHIVEVAGAAHNVSAAHACTSAMLSAFYADPSRPPGPSCVTPEMAAIDFPLDIRVARGVGHFAAAMSVGAPPAGSAAAGASLLLLATVIGWPLAAGVARLRRRERVARTPLERRARWGAVAFVLLALAFVGALAAVMTQTAAENPFILLFGLPGWAAPLLWAPWLLLAGSAALVVTAAWAWRRGAWTRWGRIHFSLVALASAVLVATLFVVGLV